MWRNRCRFLPTIMLVLSLATGCHLPGATAAQADSAGALRRALAWLHSQQGADGRFGTSHTVQDAAATADVVYALALAGEDLEGKAWERGGRSLVQALAELAPDYVRDDAGKAGKVMQAVVAAGADPRRFGGVDYIAIIEQAWDAARGLYHPTSLYRHALVVHALAVAGEEVPAAAIATMLAMQSADGGWAWMVPVTRTLKADVDSTARVLHTLIVAGVPITSSAVLSATAFLAAQQRPDGGWSYSADTDTTNANSTALAIQALVAAGIDPTGPAWRKGNVSPLDVLLAFQQADGAFVYAADTPGAPLLATLDALVALAMYHEAVNHGFLQRPAPVAEKPTSNPSGGEENGWLDGWSEVDDYSPYLPPHLCACQAGAGPK